MPQLVSVRFRFNPKALWFDPQGKSYTTGTEVLVETERGREVGTVVDPNIQATDKQIGKLKSPLKPVIRELTELDHEHVSALDEKGRNAMPYFREKVTEYELDIKPVEVQYLFSGERAIFFFSSEERVDFRELVRDLAQHFHVRIDMRQIGARDEAKEIGGIAHCGEEYCCTRFGGEFQPVSIRMAKEQDLPLNPTKISGVCGRLMCCLRYEYEAYKDFKKRAPKKGTPVDTPLGEAVISGYNTPSETMELKLEDGKRLSVPLAEMECHKGSSGACSRCSVNSETIERCASRSMLIALGALDNQLDDILLQQGDVSVETTGEGDQGRRKRRRRNAKKTEDGSAAGSSSRQRQTQSAETSAEGAQSSGGKRSNDTRKRRRRSSAGNAGQGAAANQSTGQQTQQRKQGKAAPKAERGQKGRDNTASKPRPGQNSSGLRKRRSHSSNNQNAQGGGQTSSQASSQAPNQASSSPKNAKNTGRSAQDAGQGNANIDTTDVKTSSSRGARRPRRRHDTDRAPSAGEHNTRGTDAAPPTNTP